MTRKKVLIIVNSGVGLLFLCVSLTGLLSDELSNRFFQIVHKNGGRAFIIFASAHLVLNWAWVKNNFFKQRKKTSS